MMFLWNEKDDVVVIKPSVYLGNIIVSGYVGSFDAGCKVFLFYFPHNPTLILCMGVKICHIKLEILVKGTLTIALYIKYHV